MIKIILFAIYIEGKYDQMQICSVNEAINVVWRLVNDAVAGM